MNTLQQNATLNATITFIEAPATHTPATETAKAILAEVMQHRRLAGSHCTPESPCPACMAPHLPKLVAKIEQGLPVTFVLPAFPGKSPNLAKVLGVLPDLAERQALTFLQQLCERIGRIYEPGARVMLASDGRVFSDVVGMKDEDVSAYRDELLRLIDELGLKNIDTFNLEDKYDDLSFDAMRTEMMVDFGTALEDLRAAVRRAAQDPDASNDDKEINRLYCGITRFLVEDASFPGQTLSRNQIQKGARERAYEVIQRSAAWSGVVERHFTDAVRLSIHPHGCGAQKLGIHLTDAEQGDAWLTPWHAAAVEVEEGRFALMKRSQAEALGARVVERDGRPSHLTLVG